MAREPLGRFLLIGVAVGFAGYALWQLSIAAVGRSARSGSDRPAQRVAALLSGGLYSFFCFSTAALAAGSSRAAAGGDVQEVDWTATVMHHTFGRSVVGLAGAALVICGGLLACRAVSGRRETAATNPPSHSASGRRPRSCRLTTRGIIVSMAGIFLLQSAIDLDPRKAKGLDGTLKGSVALAETRGEQDSVAGCSKSVRWPRRAQRRQQPAVGSPLPRRRVGSGLVARSGPGHGRPRGLGQTCPASILASAATGP